MAKRPLMISVDDVDREMWKECAKKSDLSLAEWVRRRCNGEGHAVEDNGVIRQRPVVEVGTTEGEMQPENPVAEAFKNLAKKRDKAGPEYSETCEHNMARKGCPRCKMNATR